MVTPSREEFLQIQDGKRRLVYREFLADIETPLSAYWKLAHDEEHSFLLESVVGGEQLARYSILGVRPRKVIRTKGPVENYDDPLALLKAELSGAEVETQPGFPAFSGGAVGLLSYDLVRYFERRVGVPPIDDLDIPELAVMICDTTIVFDHVKNIIRVVVVTDPNEAAYNAALAEIDRIAERLQGPLPELPAGRFDDHSVVSNMTQSRFEDNVRRIKEYIEAGDGIQMVPSLRFSRQVDAHPVSLYRALRSINPSPYMFLLRMGDFDLVGASPEILVSLHNGKARVRPIAGTRWRGATPEADQTLADELLTDEKERAEHIMLVDLGRNDLGRVCKFGSVNMNELMVIERYSHVMHIVSDVTGELTADRDVYDLIRATFPAGTVSGAPKVRAMQIIAELEPTRRGSYAGAVGFISNSGDADLCIAIRTILLKGDQAYVQAGAGIVYDSDPTKEYEECRNKAKAALRAIELASEGL